MDRPTSEDVDAALIWADRAYHTAGGPIRQLAAEVRALREERERQRSYMTDDGFERLMRFHQLEADNARLRTEVERQSLELRGLAEGYELERDEARAELEAAKAVINRQHDEARAPMMQRIDPSPPSGLPGAPIERVRRSELAARFPELVAQSWEQYAANVNTLVKAAREMREQLHEAGFVDPTWGAALKPFEEG